MPPAVARTGTRGAYALSFGMLAAGISLYSGPVRALSPLRTGVSLSPVVVALLTLALSASAITLQFRRQGHTLSMTEIPLAIGLFALSPGALLLAKMAGHAADGVRRRLPVQKMLFNVALVAFQVPLGVLLFRTALGHAAAHGPRGWFAAGAAVVLSNVISFVAIFAVIALTQSRIDRGALDVALFMLLIVSVVETSLGMLTVEVLRAEPRTAWLLLVVTLLLFTFSRAYGSLRDRNDELAAVYDFGRTVEAPDRPRPLAAFVAAKVRDLLRAERVDVVLAYD